MLETIELYPLKGLKGDIPNFFANTTKNVVNPNLIDFGVFLIFFTSTFFC